MNWKGAITRQARPGIQQRQRGSSTSRREARTPPSTMPMALTPPRRGWKIAPTCGTVKCLTRTRKVASQALTP